MNIPTITSGQISDFFDALVDFSEGTTTEAIVINDATSYSIAHQCEAPTEAIRRAIEGLGLDPRDVVRGSLSVTHDEVRWLQVARDAAAEIVVRDGKPVAFLRVVKVVEASGDTPSPDPAV